MSKRPAARKPNLVAVLQKRAATDANARFVLGIMQRRALGLTRQQTVEEIAAKFASGEYGTPQPLVTHPSGQSHIERYRCPECEGELLAVRLAAEAGR